MAWYKGKEGKWITTDTGRHVFIPDGEDEEAYLKKFFDTEKSGESNGLKFDTDKVYYKDFGSFYREISEDEYNNSNDSNRYGVFEVNEELSNLFEEFMSEDLIEEYDKKTLSEKFYSSLPDSYSYAERRLLRNVFLNKVKDAYVQNLKKIPKTQNISIESCTADVNVKHYNESYSANWNSLEFKKYTQNCQRCVVAYEMRRRGYDVEADAWDAESRLGYNYNNLKKSFLNYDEYINTQSYDTRPDGSPWANRKQLFKAAEKNMLSEGEGARFIVDWNWKKFKSGHTINAEVIDGKLLFIDSQNGHTYDINKLIEDKLIHPNSFTVTRVDKMQLSGDVKGVVTWKK